MHGHAQQHCFQDMNRSWAVIASQARGCYLNSTTRSYSSDHALQLDSRRAVLFLLRDTAMHSSHYHSSRPTYASTSMLALVATAKNVYAPGSWILLLKPTQCCPVVQQ